MGVKETNYSPIVRTAPKKNQGFPVAYFKKIDAVELSTFLSGAEL